MTGHPRTDCVKADELAAPYAVGALEPADELAVSAHLATCDHPHDAAREIIGAAEALSDGLEPVAAPRQLRSRLMATIAATPQDHRPSLTPGGSRASPVARWWQRSSVPVGLAAVALAAAIGLGSWAVTLNARLADRELALRIIATADAIYEGSGSAGTGWLIENDGSATFLAGHLADLAPGERYQLWLIDVDGDPLAAGVIADPRDASLIRLDRDIGDATAFAISIESTPVEAPTSEPVLTARLGT